MHQKKKKNKIYKKGFHDIETTVAKWRKQLAGRIEIEFLTLHLQFK
jgi:hypothetical protein